MKIQWKSMPSPGKGKAKNNPARARRVARKEKKATQAKVTILDVLDMSAHHGLHLNFQW